MGIARENNNGERRPFARLMRIQVDSEPPFARRSVDRGGDVSRARRAGLTRADTETGTGRLMGFLSRDPGFEHAARR